MIKPQEHNSARELFFQTDHSQAEIARQVGVEAKTVNLWVKNGRWKEIKEAARRTPSILVEQYFTQLAELNNAIANRDEGSRFPTLKEAETMRKLIVCINNIQKQTSLGASIDVVQNFLGRVSSRDNDLAQKVIPYANEFLQGKELNGHKSFELAYDVLDHSQSILVPAQTGVNDQSLDSEENMSPSPLEKDGMRQYSQSDHSQSIPAPAQTGVNEQSSEIPSLKGDVPASMNIDAEQGDVTIRDEQSPTEIPPSDHSQSIPVPAQTGVNDESLNEQEQVIYLPRCIRDPNDPYTFYYDKITRRTADSPKYGKPPDGFREVPKKDCLDKDYYGKGFGRYNWL